MARAFTSDLSVSGIEKLKKQINQYKNTWLVQKCREYVLRLSEMGVEVAQTNINESPLGRYIQVKTTSRLVTNGYQTILVAIGESFEHEDYEPFNTLLAIEFGAGIYYNPVPHPNAQDLGFGVGTFPGQKHAFEDEWWFWDDKKGMWIRSRGVKATMPMYKADQEIINNLVKIAKEVFRR